ncbi:hypothetical protein NliqN6_0688 [Naganishia liquefaciens]|uniref:Integral membrane protein n=1 Tax=Naganishia liquefaciens TaxID=104408 RepID=A0A8H3TNA9_9TREE|nr:hypothetical protein NliqN6_0688 [Naganishia liquefaciens]
MKTLAIWAALSFLGSAVAHEHHTVEEIDLGEPIDAILWIHMILQIGVWGFLFPIGMVLGLSKSRWHVPVQSTGIVLTIAGIFLGHHHKGRQFPATAHGVMATVITFLLVAQTSLGVYLKLHIHEGSKIRLYSVRIHGVIGRAWPIVGWVQMLLGVVTALGYCTGGNLGQCLAHYIMGSAFIGYACILVIMLQLGAGWLKRRGQSQEYFDSWVICVWGIVNTFTEHHDAWNKNWSHKDMQHTMMGVLWWAGGALGVFLSRKGKRSFVPAVIIIMTGWGMSAHEQALMISSKIHALFGYALMAAGVVRIIEVCFVLQDSPSDSNNIRILQYLPPYLLVLGGTMFMGATDEEMRRADGLGIDHVTYALFVFSLSFIIFLHISFLVHLYSNSGRNKAVNEEVTVKEEGYEAIRLSHSHSSPTQDLQAESFELADRRSEDGDPVDLTGKDEIDWMRSAR